MRGMYIELVHSATSDPQFGSTSSQSPGAGVEGGRVTGVIPAQGSPPPSTGQRLQVFLHSPHIIGLYIVLLHSEALEAQSLDSSSQPPEEGVDESELSISPPISI